MGAKRQASEVRRFVAAHHGVEAVVQRIGHATWDLVLVDAEGAWDRWVYGSDEDARGAATAAGLQIHDGWDDRLSQRVTKRDEWGTPGGTHRAL